MPPERRRARRTRVKPAAAAPVAVVTGSDTPVAATVPQVGTPEWDKAHLEYLNEELHKYEASNPEAADRLRLRIKTHKAKMKG